MPTKVKIPIRDILFVLLQFALFVAFVFDEPTLTILFPAFLFWFAVIIFVLGAIMVIVSVVQLNVHLSPFPSPLPGSKLVQSGIYKFVRHPIYSGVILAFLGFAIISDSGYRIMISLLLFILFYFKTIYEERKLNQMFSEYSEYKKHTGRFFPRIG